MTTASSRAAEINAETEARAAAHNITFYGMLVTDETHWDALGVHTGEELDRYLAWEGYCDLHKEVRGIKPRWTDWRTSTAEEWDAKSDDLAVEIDETAAEISWEETRGIY